MLEMNDFTDLLWQSPSALKRRLQSQKKLKFSGIEYTLCQDDNAGQLIASQISESWALPVSWEKIHSVFAPRQFREDYHL